MTSYAVIQTGGKQYQVKSGDVIDVEKLEAQVGARVELADVRFVSEESGVVVGTPIVDGAMVTAEVEDQFRGPKIIVFKYKSKTHYRKKNGHRQSYTRIRIQDILTGGATPPPLVAKDKVEPTTEGKPTPARRTRVRAATTTTEASASTAATTEGKPTPARRTRVRAATTTTEASASTAATTEGKPTPARRTKGRAATATTEASAATTEEKPTAARSRRPRANATEAAAEETPAEIGEPTLEAETPAEETTEETKD